MTDPKDRHPKPGVIIGKYRLIRQLNSGGMGQVFQAREIGSNGEELPGSIVLKLPRLAVLHDERVIDGLIAEAKLMRLLQHNNIPKVLDYGTHEGLAYFVMEFIPGVNLAALMLELWKRARPVELELAVHIVRELGYALRYAHNFERDGVPQNILHRDVASKNAMVDGDGGVHLLDFGVAKTTYGKQTSAHTIKGTLQYMAPEHALGHPTRASDVFGLGTILWELVYGVFFRSDMPRKQLYYQVCAGELPEARAPRPIPPLVLDVLEGTLQPDEKDRMSLDMVVQLLEKGQFPAARMPLGGLVNHLFGSEVRRSGDTEVLQVAMPDELDQVLRAAKAIADGPALGPVSLPPSAVPRSPIRPAPPTVVEPLGPLRRDQDDERPPQFQDADGATTPPAKRSLLPTTARLLPGEQPINHPRTELLPPMLPADARDGQMAPQAAPVRRADADAPVPVRSGRTTPSPTAAATEPVASTLKPEATDPTLPDRATPIDLRPPSGAMLQSDVFVQKPSRVLGVLKMMVGAIAILVASSGTVLLVYRGGADDAPQNAAPVPSALSEPPSAAVAKPEPEPELTEESALSLEPQPPLDSPPLPEPEPSSAQHIPSASPPNTEPQRPEPQRPEPKPKPEPEPKPEPKAEPRAPDTKAEKSKPRKKPKPSTMVPVTLRLGLTKWSEVKIAGHHIANPDRSLVVQVPARTVVVRWRTEENGPWRKQNKTFHANNTYTLMLFSNGPKWGRQRSKP